MGQDPLHLVCIEPKFPGRLGPLADWLVRRRGYRCQFFCAAADPRGWWPESAGGNLEVVVHPVGGVAREPGVHWTRDLERGLCYAYGAWEALEARRPRPVDLVLGRSADLGSSLFAPVYAPRVPLVNLLDYYYQPDRGDLADEDAPHAPPAYRQWRRAHNAMMLLDLENGARGWTPTRWQRDGFPAEYRDEILVRFDGVDARRPSRGGPSGPRSIAGRPIPAGTRVVSFAASDLDRLRGFDRFVALAGRLAAEDDSLLFVACGSPVVRRGLDLAFFGKDHAAHVLAGSPLRDSGRLWCLGAVPPATVAEVLAASDLHVDPGRDFPVSRALAEAMAAGCVVVASDSPPVREFLDDGRTARLVPPADPDAWFVAARRALADPAGHRPLGDAAAEIARERLSRDANLPALASWFAELAGTGA